MTYSIKTPTYPGDFIRYLGELLEWVDSEPMNDAWTLGSMTVSFDGEDVGKILYLDDQWQFEPDTAYWGLEDRTSEAVKPKALSLDEPTETALLAAHLRDDLAVPSNWLYVGDDEDLRDIEWYKGFHAASAYYGEIDGGDDGCMYFNED